MNPPIVLVGFMGSGKTTVGRLLAESGLARGFIDLDDLVARREGHPPGELIRSRGEAAFRAAELRALRQALAARNTVMAAGGGVVATPLARRALAREAGVVVWLRVSAGEAARRVNQPKAAAGQPTGRLPDRPLFPGDRESLDRLLAEREPWYAEVATLVVDTDSRSPAEVAALVAASSALIPAAGQAARSPRPPHAAARPPRPPHAAGRGSASDSKAPPLVLAGGPAGHGPVLVGHDLLGRLPRLPGFPPDVDGPVFLIADALAASLHGEKVERVLAAAGLSPVVYSLAAAEEAKTPAGLAGLWRSMARAGVSRGGLVVSLGGGATSDLAGFAAATFARGLRVVHLPTTILGQVDAAVGGKTAVNLPEGKNLAGVVHFPALTVVDLDTCLTLPEGLAREGLVEAGKTLLVTGVPLPRLRRLVAGALADLAGGRAASLARLVAAAIRAKLRVVRDDPFDRGLRQSLNLGHTFGHALEAASGFGRVRHGLAVGVGILAAVKLSELRGLLGAETAGDITSLFVGLLRPRGDLLDPGGGLLRPSGAAARLPGLPPANLDPEEVAARARTDKKKQAGRLVYILLADDGPPAVRPVPVADVSPSDAAEALAWAMQAVRGPASPGSLRGQDAPGPLRGLAGEGPRAPQGGQTE